VATTKQKKVRDPNEILFGHTLTAAGAEAVVRGECWLIGRDYAPTKKAVGTRIAICTTSRPDAFRVLAHNVLGDSCYEPPPHFIIGSVILEGYASFVGKKPLLVGINNYVADKIKSSDWYVESSRFHWVVKDPLVFETPLPHVGGLSLWKVREPLLGQLRSGAFKQEVPFGYTPTYAEGVVSIESGVEKMEISWKNKKVYPLDTCTVLECVSPADGFMSTITPKGLRFRAICLKCSLKYTTHKPISAQELAQQRTGVEDLALVLDSTPERVRELLDEERLSDRGERILVPGEAPLELVSSPRGVSDDGASTAVVPKNDPDVAQAKPVAVIPRERLIEAEQEAQTALAALQNFHIRDQAGMDLAANIVKTTKLRWEEIEDLRKTAKKPLDAAVKEVQNAFKPALEALSAIETLLKARMLEGQRRIHAAQDEALRVALSAFQQGDAHTAALATQQAQAASVSLPQGISVRPQIRFTVTNINIVPREFFVLSESLVLHALAAGLTIPGIEKVIEESVAVRA
jgi:hypothetical protein